MDYVALVLLDTLSNSHLLNNLVFKGGTAIKRCFYPDARFSIDLDFLEVSNHKNDIEYLSKFYLNSLKTIFENEFISNIRFGEVYLSSKTEVWITYGIEYQIHEYKFFAKIDIQPSKERNPPKEERRILTEPFYGDTREIITLPIESILADKIEALVERTHSKDLWDIYFIILKNPNMDIKLRGNIKYKIETIFRAIDLITEQDYQRLRMEYLPSKYKETDFNRLKETIKAFIKAHWNVS